MMLRTFRYAYILAKIYGIFSRSFIGENYKDILRLKKVGDIYDRLFPGERKEVPEYQLTAELERKVVEAGIHTMTSVLELLGTDEPILVHMLRKVEYQAVKSAVRGIANNQPAEVLQWDLGKYSRIVFAPGLDPKEVLASGPYAWILPLLSSQPLVKVENEIDRKYYGTLLDLARALPRKDKAGVSRLVSLEIVLANVVWALRLRFYFGIDAEKAADLLIPGMADADRRAVALVFDIPPDSVEGWRKWRFSWLIEDQLSEAFQAPDPIRAEQKAARRLYVQARRLFHQDPFTLTPLTAFFKLKEYESSMLSTAVEALRLSVPEQEVLTLVGA